MCFVYEDDYEGTRRQKLEIKKHLQKMQKDIASGSIEDELDRIWDKIARDAIALCPVDTATLASTIRVVKGEITGAGASDKSITLFDRSIIAGDETRINPKTHKPCNYAQFVHDGYSKSGKMFAGVPFLTEALALNEAEIMNAINRALAKLGKDFTSGSKN